MQNTKEYSRWAQRGPSTFIPSDNILIKEALPAGVFSLHIKRGYNGDEIVLKKIEIDCSNLLEIKQPEEEYLNKLLDNFCSKKAQFTKLKIAYKTGILLYGVPGGGKTSILNSLISRIERLNGVCFLLKNTHDVYNFDEFYKTVYRKIEPDRLIMNIFEDIDGMASGDAETTLINILDGIGDCNNVINIATTNYTEKLSERLVNRPGRFDRRIEIKSPTYDNRMKYLRLRLPEEFQEKINIEHWVKSTENFTLAQLNEVVKSVLLLDEQFDEIVDRIRKMCKIPNSYDYNKESPKSVGFKNNN
jgi:hypothetical protein